MKECHKTKYATKEFALNDVERFQNSGRKHKPIGTYRCHNCGTWHLTSNRTYNLDDIQEINQLKQEIKQLKSQN